jgi:general secretion pathway protein J
MRQAGFTLLELMVAMALLALLGLVLAGGMRFGLQAWNRLDATLDRDEPIALSQVLLRRTVEQALPLPAAGAAPGVIDFAGGNAGLRFIAPLPERAAGPGLNQVTIRLEPSEAGFALVLSWQPFGGAGAGGRKSLLDGILAGHFRYYGDVADGRPANWQEEWSNARALPRVVALDLSFKDRRIAWPSLMIAPAAMPDLSAPAS